MWLTPGATSIFLFAGAKPPECTACPHNYRDQPANEHRHLATIRFLFFKS